MLGAQVAQAATKIISSGVYAARESAVDVEERLEKLFEARFRGRFKVQVIMGCTTGGERAHVEAGSSCGLE